MKLRRPKDYQPIPGVADMPPSAGGLMPPPPPGVYNVVPDGPNKIFIGGIPLALTAENVQDLLATFGPLKHFHLVTDPLTQQPKGFAFCEYEDSSLTDLAIEGLDKMDIGGKTLTVQRASIRSSVPGPPMGMPGMPPPGMPGAAFSMPGVDVSAPVTTTRILVLMNMVTEEELRDDGEYQEIKEDVTEECSKFGQVVSMEIPRPVEGQNGEFPRPVLPPIPDRYCGGRVLTWPCVWVQCQGLGKFLLSTRMLQAQRQPSGRWQGVNSAATSWLHPTFLRTRTQRKTSRNSTDSDYTPHSVDS